MYLLFMQKVMAVESKLPGQKLILILDRMDYE